ncbi:MAG: prohibitin family protein [Spirochaetia bacterium]|nr:prohibitin family protein [Spirochaetia bacterium]
MRIFRSNHNLLLIINYISILLFILIFSNCGSTVKAGQIGLVWKPFSQVSLQKEPLFPGFYLLFPWNDIYTYSTQWDSNTEIVDVMTKDDLQVNVSSTIIIRPAREELYQLQIEIGTDYYAKIVRPEFRTSVRNIVSVYQFTQISKNSPIIGKDIKNAVIDRIAGKHIEIFDVIIDDVNYPKDVLYAIEKKITKEQELEQKKYELGIAEKDIEIAKKRATADSEAQIIRAEGQAKSQEIIDKKLTPQYLQYKAFESNNSKFFYIPSGKGGLPLVIGNSGEDK